MITNSGYAVKWTPLGKGVPGWLCDGAGDIILFYSAKVEPEVIMLQTKRNLPGEIWGIYLYIDHYPERDPYKLLMCPEEATFNYA